MMERYRIQRLSIIGMMVISLCSLANAEETSPLTRYVGISGIIEQAVVAGPELEVIPQTDRKAPLVVRIVAAYPHGTAFRYDIEFYGLEPGTYDLMKYLRPKDGSAASESIPLNVTIVPALGPGPATPHPLTPGKLPWLGGYRETLLIGGILWFIVLMLLLFWRRGNPVNEQDIANLPAATLADQLRPIVQNAIAGKSSTRELAALEQMLLSFWRKKLGVERLSPRDAITALKSHPESAALLVELENWLHRPGERRSVDVAELLLPYQDLPAEPELAEVSS